ncbi:MULTISPECIES: dipeptide/oligopeptide/nickel ABC transporter permease/ATP-binding protein [unclassified Microbacterium]|uniref:dipeptide/oligopeptide/nickel ABC transporter permease/ATP-binding protein n=1 Tax=unclassified Microbacterium TaxID=2609290 RepID=UPI00214BCAB2|nr:MULTISPECIES: dipeptide/oligopeptide/nickel ABC transporter permease/ATP-binding protein [unclassified Microbacterium]MCR2784616.1 dipeptide/oligopeptide/nickel ABC transporter permease/ATP-binding protein [Microbacterium sp. zg.B96]MDL5353049.1 dipeptide/oligopeptide/nickel ABC transporter permease/ATP-binding protein [Microbacterium sp. zg-YB36]WIM16159.1 dipeptide/oligopeptide/nickel ABC transporter permease/ATP-binding protein [Microbacterium sp. zg-B96]
MTDAQYSQTVAVRTPKGAPAQTGTGRTLRRIARQPLTVIALSWLLIVVAAAVFAPLLAPYDPLHNDFDDMLSGPTAEHWLGTDENGRDVLSRILYGARIALLVGFGAVIIAMLIGVPIGLLLGFRGGWTDRIGTRFVDVFDALPGILVAFAVIAILGRGLLPLLLAIGLMFCMNFARMARAITLAERHKLYVDAARVSGLRESAILFKQVLPNLTAPLIVQAAIMTGTAIIIESALSFLGIGLESSTPSWGGLLGVAAAKLALQPFLAIPPGVAIVLTVLAFNTLGDGLNDALGVGRRKPFRRSKRTSDSVARTALRQAPAAGGIAAAEAGGFTGVPIAMGVPAGIDPSPVTRDEATVDHRPADPENILEVRNLTIELQTTEKGNVDLVSDVSLSIRRGEIVGMIGESGSGKSTFARAVLGLLAPGIGVSAGSILLDGEDVVGKTEKQLRGVRGSTIAAVFQDPMAALSPVHTIGKQLAEPLRAHFGMSRSQARTRSIELLDRVGVKDAQTRLGHYPHQFSGGMAQRVAIAMALASRPALMIADEATSALDVTTQAQVLDLLLDLRDEYGMAILLITHDMGVVAEACDRAAVMYRGELVEVTETAAALFDAPQHPYTTSLLAARERTPRPTAEVSR